MKGWKLPVFDSFTRYLTRYKGSEDSQYIGMHSFIMPYHNIDCNMSLQLNIQHFLLKIMFWFQCVMRKGENSITRAYSRLESWIKSCNPILAELTRPLNRIVTIDIDPSNHRLSKLWKTMLDLYLLYQFYLFCIEINTLHNTHINIQIRFYIHLNNNNQEFLLKNQVNLKFHKTELSLFPPSPLTI